MWAYTNNENTQPLPLKARFVPRTEKIRTLIEGEAINARERLKAWDGKSAVRVEQFM